MTLVVLLPRFNLCAPFCRDAYCGVYDVFGVLVKMHVAVFCKWQPTRRDFSLFLLSSCSTLIFRVSSLVIVGSMDDVDEYERWINAKPAKTLPTFKKISHSEAKDTKLHVTDASSAFTVPRRCTVQWCKNTIPEDSPLKSCSRCRAKQAEGRKRRKEREREQLLAETGEDGEKMLGVEEQPRKKQKTQKNAKNARVRKYGPEMRLDAAIAAYVRARRAEEGAACTLGKRKLTQEDALHRRYEYQSSTQLYDALGEVVKNYYKTCQQLAEQGQTHGAPLIEFKGAYSIIADPSIENKKRVRLESSVISKIVQLPHRCALTLQT